MMDMYLCLYMLIHLNIQALVLRYEIKKYIMLVIMHEFM
jgi:hypothetical protein